MTMRNYAQNTQLYGVNGRIVSTTTTKAGQTFICIMAEKDNNMAKVDIASLTIIKAKVVQVKVDNEMTDIFTKIIDMAKVIPMAKINISIMVIMVIMQDNMWFHHPYQDYRPQTNIL